jgi:tetratricopeptide (TPR) repeat protein
VADEEPKVAQVKKWISIVAAVALSAGNAFAQSGAADNASILALQNAAQHAPQDADLHLRLSQAYAFADQPQAALDAIERALTLKPDEPEFLRSRGTLATWVGDYSRAQESYRRLLKLQPSDVEASLNLARVSAWSGNTDEAVEAYRRYLKATPGQAAIWIELAKAEWWRGNYGAALDTLSGYRARFGESPEYSRVLAAVLARSGEPGKALDTLEPMLHEHPDDYELNLTRAVALTMQGRAREASDALGTVQRLQPNTRDTRDAERTVRAVLASTAEPGVVGVYGDSSSLEVQRFAPRATVQLSRGTTFAGGYEHEMLTARAGSGLEQIDGNGHARHEQVWAGATQKVGRVNFRGRVGQERAENRDQTAYAIGADLTPFDRLRLSVERNSGFFALSPRTVGLGLRQLGHRAQVEWSPTVRSQIGVDALHQTLSDGNRRWEFTISPRRRVARTERLNLDLGFMVSQLGTTANLDHGYYDPRRYEYYAATAYPYWKLRESIGVGLSLAAGTQRDTDSHRFRFGGNAMAEATFGIYNPWVLKVNGGGIFNQRLGTGAYRGYGAGVTLIRRF